MATAFIKDGKKRPCCFQNLHDVSAAIGTMFHPPVSYLFIIIHTAFKPRMKWLWYGSPQGRESCVSFPSYLQAITAVDKLIMHELPKVVPDLANVAQGGRSDAMCAIYPGQGTRFAKHIDNSANDGRRLTCLCYLNNGWTPEMGGCLRLFSPGGYGNGC